MNKNTKGFTLVELLLVIAIIGILAGVVLAVINPVQQRQKAREGVNGAALSKACLAVKSCIAASSQTTQSCPAGWNAEYTSPSGALITGCGATLNALNATCPSIIDPNTTAITSAQFLRLAMANGAKTCQMSCSLSTGAITKLDCATN